MYVCMYTSPKPKRSWQGLDVERVVRAFPDVLGLDVDAQVDRARARNLLSLYRLSLSLAAPRARNLLFLSLADIPGGEHAAGGGPGGGGGRGDRNPQTLNLTPNAKP